MSVLSYDRDAATDVVPVYEGPAFFNERGLDGGIRWWQHQENFERAGRAFIACLYYRALSNADQMGIPLDAITAVVDRELGVFPVLSLIVIRCPQAPCRLEAIWGLEGWRLSLEGLESDPSLSDIRDVWGARVWLWNQVRRPVGRPNGTGEWTQDRFIESLGRSCNRVVALGEPVTQEAVAGDMGIKVRTFRRYIHDWHLPWPPVLLATS